MTTDHQHIELIQDFVNTRDVESGADEIGTPAALHDWLSARGQLDAGTMPDARGHARALAVREGIRAVGRANNGEPLDSTALAAMNEAVAATPLVVTLEATDDGTSWRLSPGAAGIDGYLGRLLAAVTATMADGSFSRLKACRNDTCRWLFHDRSRNHSGTWCSMAGCGSRMKSRAYRARQRSAATA